MTEKPDKELPLGMERTKPMTREQREQRNQRLFELEDERLRTNYQWTKLNKKDVVLTKKQRQRKYMLREKLYCLNNEIVRAIVEE